MLASSRGEHVVPLSDQDLYDFVEPNQEEESALSGGDSQHMSCIKVGGLRGGGRGGEGAMVGRHSGRR